MALGDSGDPIPVKQNDTLPTIRYAATQGPTRAPVNLSGAAIVFSMRKSTTPLTVVLSRVAASILDAAGGVMEFTAPNSTWSATNDTYQAEFEVTLPNGKVITFPPGDNYIYIKVSDDIA